MRRIAGSTATVDSKFTDGDPVTAVPATVVEDYWLNMVQEELASVIEAAGLVVGTDGTALSTQLLSAIKILAVKNVYQAIVGAGVGCTHATLALALADSAVPAGSRILICDSLTMNALISVAKANIHLEFNPGVTYSKGSSTKGLQLNANGIRIRGGRFTGFNGGSDAAIEVAVGSSYCLVGETRFSTNTNDISDLNGTCTTYALIQE